MMEDALTPAKIEVARVLRSATPKSKDERQRHALCAYFSVAMETELREAAQKQQREDLLTAKIKVEILPNASARVCYFNAMGAFTERRLQADSLRQLVEQLNREVLKPSGTKIVLFETGAQCVQRQVRALEASSPANRAGRII